jgi:hypothetical protein
MTHRWNVLVASALGAATVLVPLGASGGAAAQNATALNLHRNSHNILESSNWSGMVETGSSGAYTSVGGSWTVPTVTKTSGNSYSATWIGIDGDGNDDLIQTGTGSQWTGGKASYNAWWEILPAAETPISMSVSPGNSMTASIVKGSSSWTITIADNTTGKSFSIVKSYSGPGESIEWIEERPEVGGSLATLAKYKEVTFTNATLNGGNPNLTSSDGIEMLNNAGTKVISIPGPPSGGNSFSIAYGSKAP